MLRDSAGNTQGAMGRGVDRREDEEVCLGAT